MNVLIREAGRKKNQNSHYTPRDTESVILGGR